MNREFINLFEHGFIVVDVIEYQSMCWEFDPGPYHNGYIVTFYKDSESKGVQFKKSEDIKKLYKLVQGKDDRIKFWRIIKSVEEVENYLNGKLDRSELKYG